MPSASEYNTYQSPLSRATALAQSRAQLAQTKEATAGARQSREFAAQREPLLQHDITLSNIGQEQKIAMMDDALRNTGLAQEIMQVAPLTGEQRRAAISDLAKTSKTPSFWQRALSVPENNQNDMFGGLIQYSQQKGYLEAPQKQAQPPTSVQEFEYAKANGFQGGYLDWVSSKAKAGAAKVNVNTASEIGSIPQGWEVFSDPQTGARSMRPIAGGPAEREIATQDIKQANKARNTVASIDNVMDTVSQAIGKTGKGTAGFASLLDFIPESGALELGMMVETIQANLGFTQLQAMRDASPTGGALGQVSERELTALQSTLVSLDRRQSPETLKRNLNKVMTHYQNWRNAVINSRGMELMSQGMSQNEVMDQLANEFP